jgi:hypothetical protein
MTTSLQLTLDLKEIVVKVTGKEPRRVFNDKRKTFERRYKFAGIFDVKPKHVKKISKKISKKYPDLQFVVKSESFKPAQQPYGRLTTFYKGLTVRVF